MSLSGWYVAFAVGAACIFVVVIAVTLVLQLARRIAVQLTDVSTALATIRALAVCTMRGPKRPIGFQKPSLLSWQGCKESKGQL